MDSLSDWEQEFAASRKAVRRRRSTRGAITCFNTFLALAKLNLNKQYPWRSNRTPYRVLISEVMLQQTQADRVVKHYRRFLKEFPSFRSLAQAPQAAVIHAWQGLGYNRRALYVHNAAKEITRLYAGRIPRAPELLQELPGIGAYTSKSILVFTYNQPHVFIETNIRSIFLYYFSSLDKPVPDSLLLPYIEAALDRNNPREWYESLMDVGSLLKKTIPGLNTHSSTYVKQSKFQGSFRQKRGALLRLLSEKNPGCCTALQNELDISEAELQKLLAIMVNEGFIRITKTSVSLR